MFKGQRSYQVSEQVVGLLDHPSLQTTGRHGNRHQVEAAHLQEDEEDWRPSHGSGSDGFCFRRSSAGLQQVLFLDLVLVLD